MENSLCLPDDVNVGDVVYSPGGTLGPRIQLNIQLVFLYQGGMTVWIDGEIHYADAYTVTLLLPVHREYFEFDRDQETKHRWMHWYNASFPEAFLRQLEALQRTIYLSDEMNRLIEKALELRFSSLPTAEMLIKILGMHMLWRYIGESQQQSSFAQSDKNQIFAIARRYIHQHYREDITLYDVAKAAAVSETHLIRLFNRYAQTTPMAYLWDLRITQALELLNRTGLSITEIATQCGFKTSYHFSRRIRERTGLTPTEFRRRSWG